MIISATKWLSHSSIHVSKVARFPYWWWVATGELIRELLLLRESKVKPVFWCQLSKWLSYFRTFQRKLWNIWPRIPEDSSTFIRQSTAPSRIWLSLLFQKWLVRFCVISAWLPRKNWRSGFTKELLKSMRHLFYSVGRNLIWNWPYK